MCGKTNPEVQGCVMPVTYSPRNRGESACSAGRKEVYWDCLGSDGSVAPANACGKTNPEIQGCTMPVTYSPRYQGESACSGGQKQVYWDCLGSDGSSAPASACGKTNPETQGCTMPVTYSWQTGGWSGYSSSCSDSSTRTRSVWCQGSDGSQPGDGPCGGGRPSSSETTGVYSGCGYTSVVGTKSACTNGTATTPLQCRRSDGVYVANSYCGTGDTKSEACTSGLANGYCIFVTQEYSDIENANYISGNMYDDWLKYRTLGPDNYPIHPTREHTELYPKVGACASGWEGWRGDPVNGVLYGAACGPVVLQCIERNPVQKGSYP
jgi:hypothetical protein